MSDQPKPPGVKAEEIDPETRKIILERLATADDEPTSDAREALAEIRKSLKHPVPR